MSNTRGDATQKLQQIQNKLESLGRRALTKSTVAEMLPIEEHQLFHMNELSKVCESFSTKISVFNNGLSKLTDHFNTDTLCHVDFIQTLSRSIPTEPVRSFAHTYVDNNQNKNEPQENFMPLLHFTESDFYKNNQLNILTNDTILILATDYSVTAKVLVKRLPDLEVLGSFIVDQERSLVFKEVYLEALDKLLNANDLTRLIGDPIMLNELFMIKTQQFNDSMRRLSKVLNAGNLDNNNRNDRLILDTLDTFNLVFHQMHSTLIDCAASISSIA